MWGCSSNYPTIGSYQAAARVYADIKPLRGKPDFRPLDARSSRAKSQIIKVGDDYIIRLYNTNIVRYRPDGSVLLDCGSWVTVATATAMSAMSPYSAWCSKGNLVVRCPDGRFIIPGAGLEIDAQGVPKNPEVAVLRKKLVNRVLAKQVRAHFKQVPVMIRAYSAAFNGGDATNPVHRPVREADMATPLSEPDASAIAMGCLDWDWGYATAVPTYSGVDTTDKFWRDVYRVFGVIEQHETPLPYGEVP